MSPDSVHHCPHCGADSILPGIRAFVTVRCPHCLADWRPRSEIGGFRLLDLRARSGLGVTFRALDPRTGATLAVKLFRTSIGWEDEDSALFEREVHILTTFEHPHWVRVFGGGVENGVPWLAMEWLSAGSFSDLLAKRGRLTEIEVLDFAAQAASALAAADHAGLRHGDLEPNSLVLADPQTLKVSDFAQTILYARAAADVGTVWGRLCYIPPERLWREDEEARSDIYSLGTILFHGLTGFAPHEGETVIDFMFERFAGNPLHVDAHVRTLHAATAALVNRMLVVEPQGRFQSWDEVLDATATARAHFENRRATAPFPARIPRAATPARPSSASGGMWTTILLLLASIGVAAWFAMKWWKPPVAEIATVATTALPVPAPILEAAPAATPAATASPMPAPPKMDWNGWRTIKLEAPTRQGTVNGEANVIPGSGALRISGNNSGIAGRSDEMIFRAGTLEGDWTLSARIVSNTGTAGLTVRENDQTGGRSLAVTLSADGHLSSTLRTQPNTAAARVSPPKPSGKQGWLRLVRRGTTVTAFHSADGKQWDEVGAFDAPDFPAKAPAGFVVWSGAKEKSAAATFDHISLSTGKH